MNSSLNGTGDDLVEPESVNEVMRIFIYPIF
jgi:hypothetical protein